MDDVRGGEVDDVRGGEVDDVRGWRGGPCEGVERWIM